MNSIEDKYILELSNREIINEIRDILGDPKLKPPGRETIGYITADATEYFKNGEVDEKKLAEIYNRQDTHIKKYAITLAINSIRNREKDLFSLIKKIKKGDRILDYGCGSGTHGIACAQKGSNVHFYDISTPMLTLTISRYLRRNLKHYPHYYEKTIPRNNFDYVFCADVIEHVPRPDIMLNNFITYLRVGGVAHLHLSDHVNYCRGHLKQSIDIWKGSCQKILKSKFKQLTDNNYKLIKK
jgi:2-polyprenyl-3-methyl-5-hydroxy-6-metoxy-1,4-benzoquinol methylase